jgi:chromosomal replication initiator protein
MTFEFTPKERELIEVIAITICNHFKIPLDKLKSKSRKPELVKARNYVMFFARPDYSLKDIGLYLGNRDHSTVVHGLSTLDDHVDTYEKYEREIDELGKLVRKSISGLSPMRTTPEVNENLDVLQELKNQI